MCGIAGKLSLDGRPVDGALVQRMASLLAHRGPDDEGVRVTGPIGLASRRLSIIDLDTGRQPIGNEDGTVWVVLNGEIYNFVELRAELERRGHRFQSRTDTEVIVHLYEDHGPALLERLRGMFAFALWDASRRRLMLARDRLGEKPLFYAHRPGRALSFASELKSLRVDAELALTLDPAAVDQYLSLLYIPAPATIFTEVRKLPAGHYLLAGEGGIEVREYWDVPLPPAGEGATLDRAALDERLSEAIRLQLRSDVPLGAFLSGGIDSTTIVAGMVEHVGPGIMTCSVGFSEAGFSELPFAERAAACVGSLHASRIAEPPSLARLQHLAWHLDEPFGDSSAVPTWEVSRLAREKVTVALSGDGGDELFGGYRRHVLEGWEHAGRAAGGALARAIGRLARAVPRGVGGRNTLARLAATPARACAEKFQFGAGAPALKAIYTRELRAALAGADPLAPFVRAYERAAGADPLNRILYVDLKTYLPDDILVKVDRMSMAHGLEVRAPFLDHRLVELVAALPGPTKVRARGAKPLLRAALARRVAREVWDRPKHGFTAPIGSWLRRELREGVEACLFAPDGLGRALFERAALRRLWQAHLGGADHAHEIWMLLMLELWHRARPDGPRAAEAAA